MKRLLIFAAFVGTVIAANWALNRYGIVPIGFGLYAPAGVYFAGLSFGLRDVLHETAGQRWVLAAIAVGAAVSYIVEGGASFPGGHAPIAVASAAAFALSELTDLAVYAPLRERHWPFAVVASNIAGAFIDSALFLWLTFGNLANLTGNVVGKTYTVAAALPLVYWFRRRDLSRHTLNPAGT